MSVGKSVEMETELGMGESWMAHLGLGRVCMAQDFDLK